MRPLKRDKRRYMGVESKKLTTRPLKSGVSLGLGASSTSARRGMALQLG